MALRIVFADPKASVQYKAAMTRTLRGIARASSLATRASAKLIRSRGQADIAQAGQFGARWQEGLIVEATPASGFFISNQITIGHDQIGARNFEFGGTIQGKPLLWIPLSFSDAKGKRAKDYPGGLFRVERKSGGPPLLLSRLDHKPKYVGKPRVVIKQKWHLRDISENVMSSEFPTLYNSFLDVT